MTTAKKKVWILDGGSLVIDRSQVLWHIDVGTSIPRRGVPADIAPAVAFLASEEAHWITGQMLTADGGHTRH
jgi:NAD(P)-dependent dehydrogenase (short-subunit alcohol dehydrogenase family)